MVDDLRKILITSVLKPVSEPRMFEKFAWTLHNKYQIHILGMPIDNLPQKPQNIYFHYPKKLDRFGKKRLLFGFFF